MLRTLCKSKIHRATVTGADLRYDVAELANYHPQFIFVDERNRPAGDGLRAVGS